MSLEEYQSKRRFQRTPEPSGKAVRRKGFLFVVQKHDARNLHYDFRLEWDGVLKSWAVPKGPCLDSSVKRLAVQVEDHPVEYGSFEGIIPRGEYGGGTVLLWDRGTWQPLGDPEESLRTGRLKFALAGEKLRGAWMLLRTRGSDQYGREKPQWLLFKERDEHARPLGEGDVLAEEPSSVLTGRTLAEIAAQKDARWSTAGRGKAESAIPHRGGKKRKVGGDPPAMGGNFALRLPRCRELLVPMQRYDARRQELMGVRLTSPEKVLYPEDNITKLELAAYFEMVSEWILPHIAGRPIVLVRCPEGSHQACFYQKHPVAGTPENLRRITIRKDKTAEKYVVVDDAKGLISLAQIAALEIHAWGSREDKPDYPDRLIFDLDPDPELAWKRVVECAEQVRSLLEELGLESFVKTTGGKGLHVVVPIERRYPWEEAKDFCRRVAELIVRLDPHHYTANMAKAHRQGRIYVDYLRNSKEATAIAPYSPRLHVRATVSVPLRWQELRGLGGPHDHTIRNLADRLRSLKQNPWQEMQSLRQGLSKAKRTLTLVLSGTAGRGKSSRDS
jgi:bifunctional non-homologous end joining protein LigD